MKKDSNWNASFNRPHSWDHNDEGWYVRYLELIEYKEEQGDCMVPRSWAKNSSLGIWVSMQRVKRKKMVSWRKELLDALISPGYTQSNQSRVPGKPIITT